MCVDLLWFLSPEPDLEFARLLPTVNDGEMMSNLEWMAWKTVLMTPRGWEKAACLSRRSVAVSRHYKHSSSCGEKYLTGDWLTISEV